MRFEPVTANVGARVLGLDPAVPLTDDEFTELDAALARHGVLFLEDVAITPAQQQAFAARFGPLQRHPAYDTAEGADAVTLLESTPERPTRIEMWHADMTFTAQPPRATMLVGRVIPDVGGDTLWASTTAAYAGLSPALQALLLELTAVHDFRQGFRESLAEPGGAERLADAVAANPPVEHPVVIRHPVSGAPALYVNSLFTTHIRGMTPRESRALLDLLYEHIVQPEYCCRFRWRPNAMALWDNRCTQHKPVNDYFPAHRLMHRVTVEGERPAA